MTTTNVVQLSSITPHPSVEYWSVCKVEALFETPFLELVYRAAQVHREHFNPGAIQLSTLMSIKTGGCPEDCGYCPQSARYQTGVQNQQLLDIDEIVEKAKIAKARGAGRFCMGAAWRGPKPKDMEKVTAIIRAVKDIGLETCGTFGLLQDGMAEELKDAGLDYYNHNLDTAPENYHNVIGTRRFDDRLSTLVKVEGTPMADAADLDWTEFVRTIAVARITMPKSYVRLSAGRQGMSEEMQAMCFMAGANSIFYGDKLLVTGNPEEDGDQLLMAKLDLEPETEENRKPLDRN